MLTDSRTGAARKRSVCFMFTTFSVIACVRACVARVRELLQRKRNSMTGDLFNMVNLLVEHYSGSLI